MVFINTKPIYGRQNSNMDAEIAHPPFVHKLSIIPSP